MPLDIDNIPKGTWVRRKGDTIIIGASLKDSLIENLFTWSFSLAVTLLFLYIIPSQIMQGELSIYFGGAIILLSLFPFCFLLNRVLMALLGHLEICLEKAEGTVFYGIGKFGRTQTFIYSKTSAIATYVAVYSDNVPTQFGVKITAEKTIFFGGYLKNEKVNFIVEKLQIFLEDGKTIRDLLPPDLMHHLIA